MVVDSRSVIKRQAGCVPVRHRDQQLEILLVTSRYTGEWIAPKGGIEPGETAPEAAAREAAEEAGVRGRVGALLGSFDYPRAHGIGRIETYILWVTAELSSWPEQSQRRRRWFSIDAARVAVKRAEVQQMIDALESRKH